MAKLLHLPQAIKSIALLKKRGKTKRKNSNIYAAMVTNTKQQSECRDVKTLADCGIAKKKVSIKLINKGNDMLVNRGPEHEMISQTLKFK